MAFSLENIYTRAGLIVAGAVILSLIVRHVIFPLLRKVASRTRTQVDLELLRVSAGSVELLIVLIGVRSALGILGAEGAAEAGVAVPGGALLLSLVDTFIIFTVAHLAVRVLDTIVEMVIRPLVERTDTTLDDAIIPVAHRLTRVGIFIAAALAALEAWGVQVGKVWAGLGIAGIAVGFAVKDSLANIFGGISLMFDRAYKVGDWIQIESGEMGIVQDVGLRSTRIRTWDNEVVTIPNGLLATSRIQNYHQPDVRERIRIDFGVEYGSDPDVVKEVALGAIKGIEGILDDPPADCLFLAMADFSLNFQLRFWIGDIGQKWVLHQQAITRLYRALYEHGIGIPFPTHTVYVHKPPEAGGRI